MFENVITLLDWTGIIVFSLTGALVASRNQMDLVGFVLLGTVTGIGGGTLRDLLLDMHPIFWIEQPAYVLVCACYCDHHGHYHRLLRRDHPRLAGSGALDHFFARNLCHRRDGCGDHFRRPPQPQLVSGGSGIGKCVGRRCPAWRRVTVWLGFTALSLSSSARMTK
jgi:hypothetical protein